MNTHGARLLCDASDGHFDLTPGGHDQVAELVDNNNDVRHVFVSLVWTEATVDELFVVVLDVAHMRPREQFVAVVHLLAEGVERVHHLSEVRDDRLLLVRELG